MLRHNVIKKELRGKKYGKNEGIVVIVPTLASRKKYLNGDLVEKTLSREFLSPLWL
jgi:hypothetical protein